MPSKLGEFCIRCGAKCDKVVEGTNVIYTCPRNHGVQLIEPYDVAAEAQDANPPVVDTDYDPAQDPLVDQETGELKKNIQQQ